MAGGGNFIARVISYVANEVIVNGLANRYFHSDFCSCFRWMFFIYEKLLSLAEWIRNVPYIGSFILKRDKLNLHAGLLCQITIRCSVGRMRHFVFLSLE